MIMYDTFGWAHNSM